MTEPEAIIERPSSRLRREFVDGKPVYRKEYSLSGQGRTADVLRARTAREVDLLTRMQSSHCFLGRLGIPRVIAADPTSAMITTAEIPGQTLEDILVGSHRLRTARDTYRALWLAGRWLRTFEKMEIRENDRENISPHDPTDLVDYCSLRLENIRNAGCDWQGGPRKSEIETFLRSSIDSPRTADVFETWCHGDFAPVNILWDRNTLTTIDFAMARVDLPFVDATYFLHRLEMFAVYFPWRRWPLAKWKEAFLSGYGRPGAEKSPLWQAQQVRHLLCRLQTYARRPTKGIKQKLHRRWILHCLRRKLESILSLPAVSSAAHSSPGRSGALA